jgi:hypothetical protein
MFLNVGDTYAEPGATAYDTADGNLTSIIKINGDVDTYHAGIYRVYYDVNDKAGNSTHVERIVVVSATDIQENTIAPVLLLNGDDTCYTPLGEEYTDADVTVADNKDSEVELRNNLVTDNKVDTANEGLYTVTYNVTDSDGNAAQPVIRTVVVWDNNHPIDYFAPNINLHWGNYYKIELGEEFKEPGYDAWDDIDRDVTDKVVVTGDVNTSIAGTYELHYTVTDSSNRTTDVIRYVEVRDTKSPIISVSGAAIMFLNVGDTYTEAGATAYDIADGNVTSKITINGDVDTSNPGTYHVYYDVVDAAGNSTHAERTVNILALDAAGVPKIILNGNMTVNVVLGTSYYELGAVAYDYDDQAYLPVSVSGSAISINTPGCYTVTYSATDSDNNVTQVTRNVIVYDPNNIVDYLTPEIYINGPINCYVNLNSVYNDNGATAWDDTDMNINSKIVTDNQVNTSVAGIYYVTYSVTDAAGNTASVQRKVEVLGYPAP